MDLVKLRYFHLISGKSKIDLRLKSLEKFAEIAHYNFFAKNISLKSKKKKKKSYNCEKLIGKKKKKKKKKKKNRVKGVVS